jgi:hypothetical protein
MPDLSQFEDSAPRRQRGGPRVRFSEITPAVVRLSDGGRVPGTLQLISVTGGLLGLSRPVRPDSEVRVMFIGPTGSVLGVARMLTPVAWNLQPFRFVTLRDDDRSKLKAAIQSCLEKAAQYDQQSRRDHLQIEKSRPW